MKTIITTGLLIAFTIVSFSSLIRCGNNSEKPVAQVSPNPSASPTTQATIDPAEIMTRLQRDMNKLWFAGKAENWPLSNFYVQKIGENMKIIRDNNVMDDDSIALGSLMGIMGLKPLDDLQSSVNAQDEAKFKTMYMQQVTNCNNCHINAKHPFVVIKEPTTPAYDNQVYTKPAGQ